MSTTEPTANELDLDAIDALAKRQAAGYARMLELNGGIGLLGVKERSLYEGMLEWGNATENDHADTVIALVAEVKRLRAGLAVAPAPSDDDREAIEQIIEDTASVRSGVDDYEVDNADEISGKILSYLARRSPVSPPEDVAKIIETHLSTVVGDGEVVCRCGEVLWKVGTGYTAGPITVRAGVTLQEAAHARHMAAALRARVLVETGSPKRLDPAFRADLIDFARDRIQQVWTDVPGGVDAATLASNIVAAQEFCWMSRQVPVAVPVETVMTEDEACARDDGTVYVDRRNDVFVKVGARAFELAGHTGRLGPMWIAYPARVFCPTREEGDRG